VPDALPDGQESFSSLPDSCPLYRAVLETRWVKDGIIKPRVFMRRPPTSEGTERDQKGLSVALAGDRDETTTCTKVAQQFNECKHVCRILCGTVRSLGIEAPEAAGLDVVQDAVFHANIIGLPSVPPPNIATDEGKFARAKAERIGGLLARKAVVVWQYP
jgi:hypothetical protein